MSIVLSLVSGLVSAATLVGAIARLKGPERARRRASQAKEALENAPEPLRPAFERMHWEASVHLAAVTLSAASYGRHLSAWASAGGLTLVGVGAFAALVAVEAEWAPGKGVLSLHGTTIAGAILFVVPCVLALAMAAAIEGSRRRFYSLVFDKLYARAEPDAELLKEARESDTHRGFLPLGLLFSASVVLLVIGLSVNVSLTAQGGVFSEAGINTFLAIVLAGSLGAGGASWVLFLRWNRRPLHTLFSTLDAERPKDSATAEPAA